MINASNYIAERTPPPKPVHDGKEKTPDRAIHAGALIHAQGPRGVVPNSRFRSAILAQTRRFSRADCKSARNKLHCRVSRPCAEPGRNAGSPTGVK